MNPDMKSASVAKENLSLSEDKHSPAEVFKIRLNWAQLRKEQIPKSIAYVNDK